MRSYVLYRVAQIPSLHLFESFVNLTSERYSTY